MSSDLLSGCLPFRLGAAYRRVDRLLNRAFESIGLTHAHGHILVCLLEDGELRVADVARRTGFEASTVSRLVQELGRRKLVRRRKNPDDARSLLVRPGTRAKDLRIEIEHLVRRVDERLTRDLPQADIDGFVNTTSVIDHLP